MPKPYEYIQSDLSGGLRAQETNSARLGPIGPNELMIAENVFVARERVLISRDGTRDIHVSALVASTAIQGGTTWYAPATPVDIAVCNGSLFIASATVSIPTTFTSQGGGMSATAFPTFVAFRGSGADKLFIADGGLLNSWNGTSLTENIAGTAAVTRIAVYNQRLFGIGDSAAPETLYWSELNDGDTLGNAGSGGGSAIIRTFGQSKLTGLMPLGNSLLLFHERGISIFTGWSQDDFNISEGTRGLSFSIGTVVPRSLVAIDNVGYFIGNNDVYVVTETGILKNIGQRISYALSQINPTYAANGFAFPIKHLSLILFCIPSGSTVRIFAYNYETDAWTQFKGASWDSAPIAQCGWVNEVTNPPTILLGGGTGFIRQWGNSFATDGISASGTAGVAVSAIVQSRPLWFNAGAGFAPRYALVNATRNAVLTAAWWTYIGGINGVGSTPRTISGREVGRYALGINSGDTPENQGVFRAGSDIALRVTTSVIGTVIAKLGAAGFLYNRRPVTISPTA